MPQQISSNKARPEPSTENARPGTTSSPDRSPEVEQLHKLQAAGKWKQAVELAKEHHKKQQTPQTERRLVDAYLGRIAQFQEKGAAEDARTLLHLVEERFPAHRDRLLSLTLQSAASAGDVNGLMAPLAGPDVPPDLRDLIDTTIRNQLTDLRPLTGATTLPTDHPMRIAACAVVRAFAAVTSGPVSDEQIALPEVSRKSPLAGWKLMIRALAAFYRNDDEGCRRALAGIPADAAVNRWTPILTAMMDRKPPGAGLAGALQGRVGGGDQAMRVALEKCELELRRSRPRELARAVQSAIAACAANRPALVPQLRQHLFVKAYIARSDISAALRFVWPLSIDSGFWKLIAAASAADGDMAMEAAYWERFLAHAVHERRFTASDKEAALVHLAIAEALGSLSPRALAIEMQDVSDRRHFVHGFYEDQPTEIEALAPSERWTPPSDPEFHFRKSADLWPQATTFHRWIAWILETFARPNKSKKSATEKRIEQVAEHWRRKLPGDFHPSLLLSRIAESRNALTLALKHLDSAEAADPIHPAVREARLRITMGNVRRHLKERKSHLVIKDLDVLSSLPTMQEGDRLAFVLVMRSAVAALANDADAARDFFDQAQQRAGPPLAGQMLAAVLQSFNLKPSAALPQPDKPVAGDATEIASHLTRLHALFSKVDIAWRTPNVWGDVLDNALAERPCRLSMASVAAIGQIAIKQEHRSRAYAASVVGLDAPQDALKARFLLIRAQAVYQRFMTTRTIQCLRAASMLASRANEPPLLQEIIAEVDKHPAVRYELRSVRPLSDKLLSAVLESESRACKYPTTLSELRQPVVLYHAFDTLFGGSGGGVDRFDDDEDDDDDDDDDDDFGEPALFPDPGSSARPGARPRP